MFLLVKMLRLGTNNDCRNISPILRNVTVLHPFSFMLILRLTVEEISRNEQRLELFFCEKCADPVPADSFLSESA